MAVGEEEEYDIPTRIFENLAHPLRQRILLFIRENSRTYSDIQSFLNIERGQLNFHLKKLEPLLLKEGNFYILSRYGHLAISLLEKAGRDTRGISASKPRLLLRRAAAWFIDVFLITVAALGIYAFDPQYWIQVPFFGIYVPRILAEIANAFLFIFLIYTAPTIEVLLFRISMAMILFGYWALFEGYAGQSLGKKIMGIRIRGRRGMIQPIEAAILAFGKAFLLPIDLLGTIIYRREGSARLTEHLTGASVVIEGAPVPQRDTEQRRDIENIPPEQRRGSGGETEGT